MADKMEVSKIRKVYHEMNDEQKEVVHFMIGSLIQTDRELAKFLADEGIVLKNDKGEQ